MNTDGQFETHILKLAAYLHSKDVPFNGLRRLPTGQAIFIFDQPSTKILAEWMLEPGNLINEYEESKNYLRDVLEGKR